MHWDWPYQQLIYEQLKRVTTGECKRLMIFLPPRHGKSELVTVRYTAWRLEQDPTLNVILGSYNQRLANRFSRKVRITWEDALAMQNAECGTQNDESGDPVRADSRNFVVSKNNDPTNRPDHSQLNRAATNPHSAFRDPHSGASRTRLNTVAEWETGLGGGVRAVGVGGGITGFGAKLVIIDDPVKSRAEAESRSYRQRVSDWFNDDLYTRLEPDAAIILIQTRWHEDDLAGRLLKDAQDGGEHWEVISLPALAEGDHITATKGSVPDSGEFIELGASIDEGTSTLMNPHSAFRIPQSNDPLNRQPGEALCPDRFNREDLLRIKHRLGTYSFSALYQQRPTPPEGGLFKRAWFKRIVDRPPENLSWVRGYDLAVSTKDSADYTASFRCALDKQTGDLYIAGGFRKRIEFPEQRRLIVQKIREEPNTEHGIEQALHGQAFIRSFAAKNVSSAVHSGE
jgi:hypothetical protein